MLARSLLSLIVATLLGAGLSGADEIEDAVPAGAAAAAIADGWF